MSAHGGKADIPPQGRDFLFLPGTDVWLIFDTRLPPSDARA
jgi:hypothetical protein